MRHGGQSDHSHLRSRNPEVWRVLTSCPEKPREPERDSRLLQDAISSRWTPMLKCVSAAGRARQGLAPLDRMQSLFLGHEPKCQSSWDELDFETEIKDRGGKS